MRYQLVFIYITLLSTHRTHTAQRRLTLPVIQEETTPTDSRSTESNDAHCDLEVRPVKVITLSAGQPNNPFKRCFNPAFHIDKDILRMDSDPLKVLAMQQRNQIKQLDADITFLEKEGKDTSEEILRLHTRLRTCQQELCIYKGAFGVSSCLFVLVSIALLSSL